jgi:hypothetical protein
MIKFVFISVNRIIRRFARFNWANMLSANEEFLHALFFNKALHYGE